LGEHPGMLALHFGLRLGTELPASAARLAILRSIRIAQIGIHFKPVASLMAF